ncbi:hypothetical protein D3C87_1727330 [compost metagenome]
MLRFGIEWRDHGRGFAHRLVLRQGQDIIKMPERLEATYQLHMVFCSIGIQLFYIGNGQLSICRSKIRIGPGLDHMFDVKGKSVYF